MPSNTRNFLPRLRDRLQRRGRNVSHREAAALGSPTLSTAHLHFDHRPHKPSFTLSDMHTGQSATIASIAGPASVRLLLMEMGLTNGTLVKVIRIGAFGGPLDISVRGYRLSLRREEARAIHLRIA